MFSSRSRLADPSPKAKQAVKSRRNKMPTQVYQMDLPAISSMKKAELQAELRDSGMEAPDKWTVVELRQLVMELRGPKSKDPMSAFGKMNKAELQAECTRRDILFEPKATKGWLLLRLRDELSTEPDGHTMFDWGKHKGLLWAEVYLEKPKWTEWAKETAASNSESSNGLLQYVRWVQMVEAGGPVYKTLQGRHARDEGPDEETEVPSGSTLRPKAKAMNPPPPLAKTPVLSPSTAAQSSKRSAPVDRMVGGPTPDAVAEVTALRTRLAELEALHEGWHVPDSH
jgi:hypothetical protein